MDPSATKPDGTDEPSRSDWTADLMPARIWHRLLLAAGVDFLALLAVFPHLPEVVDAGWAAGGGGVSFTMPRAATLLMDALPLIALLYFRLWPIFDTMGWDFAANPRMYRRCVIVVETIVLALPWVIVFANT